MIVYQHKTGSPIYAVTKKAIPRHDGPPDVLYTRVNLRFNTINTYLDPQRVFDNDYTPCTDDQMCKLIKMMLL